MNRSYDYGNLISTDQTRFGHGSLSKLGKSSITNAHLKFPKKNSLNSDRVLKKIGSQN